MRARSFVSLAIASLAIAFTAGCSGASPDRTASTSAEELRGPGSGATDARIPELGSDVTIVRRSKISLADGIALATKNNGPVVEAKFELADDGKSLSLSLYPVANGLGKDAERNVFQELSGDPTVSSFKGDLATFDDQEHLTRSARDLTLLQLSNVGLADAVAAVERNGEKVFWAIPTIRHSRAGYGVYALHGRNQRYHFIDGQGSDDCTRNDPRDLGDGPGTAATDARVPELGSDLSILKQSKISLADGVAQVEKRYGSVVEAKFELADDGKSLSLSIYPAGKGLKMDSERNTFFEASGDPTGATYAPDLAEFKVPDVEHLTRSSRDLTLVQTASLSLRDAIDAAQYAMPDGFVFWAIPTIRDTRSGYGVYVYGTDDKVHYFFIS